MLEKIKLLLRIKTAAFDAEINDLIAAAQKDLTLSGVIEAKAANTGDALIVRAISIYCKSHFGLDNAESEKYQTAYESLKAHLCLSEEYTAEAVIE